jgi:hypothetical protein
MSELKFTDEQSKTLKAIHGPNATPEQWNFFLQECERRNLIPGTHVVFSLTNASERDAAGNKVYTKKVTLITTINALRLLADRYSRKYPEMAYLGHGPFKYHYNTENGELATEIPRGAIPHAVSVELYRKDWLKPLVSVARFEAYAKYYGKDQARKLSDMWETRGEEQLAKCALAGGLREISPEENGGLYIAEELDSQVVESQEVSTKSAAVPEALNTPVVNQTPAQTIEKKEVKQEAKLPEQPSLFTLGPVEIDTSAGIAAEAAASIAGSVIIPAKTLTEAPQPAQVPAEPLPAAEPVLHTPEPAAASAQAPVAGSPASKEERETFMKRATKVINDLAAKSIYKGSAGIMKDYLLRVSGRQRVDRLTTEEWEASLKALEGVPLEQALVILKG